MAHVSLTPEAAKQLAKLPRVIRERMGRVFERLEKWPEVSGAKALSGNLAGYYRTRTGDYRVLFCVKGDAVLVTRIGHRSEFYED